MTTSSRRSCRSRSTQASDTATAPTTTHDEALAQCLATALVAAAQDAVRMAGAVLPGTLDLADLAEVLQRTAELESAAAALRLALCAEADTRRIAEDPHHGGAATGTDAWLAALLGTTRASQAAGLRLGRLLTTTYHATREAFAAGHLRPDQVAAAEAHLLAKATGQSTRSGKPMNATRLRQAARRMFDPVDRSLADEHEHAMLAREKHGADQETFLSLHDNGDGTWTGKFRIPELHGNLLATVLGHLTSPRRLAIKAPQTAPPPPRWIPPHPSRSPTWRPRARGCAN